jgi:hypothetical protein
MRTLGSRARRLVVLSGLDLKAASLLCGFGSDAHMGQIVRASVRDPRCSSIGRMAEAFGATTDWLILGRGDPPTKEAVAVAIRLYAERKGVHAANMPARNVRRKGQRLQRCARSGARAS